MYSSQCNFLILCFCQTDREIQRDGDGGWGETQRDGGRKRDWTETERGGRGETGGGGKRRVRKKLDRLRQKERERDWTKIEREVSGEKEKLDKD